MINYQDNSFGMVRNQLENICDLYRIAQIKLNNLNNNLLNPITDPATINKYRNYINTVELVLHCLTDEDAALIRNACIQRQSFKNLGYSTTTYYCKYRRAAISFLKYFS
ncbi:MAG: hypothetical protein LBJ97_02360 [Mycoplasmataceae bacterium]|jgi:hypothetical protein|nr:hypothetical protein [Mycoplasmataceae bacterium]